ncbi:MAG: GNAT family N-acetyltransferase [Rhodospirillaceae bacterium]|nr:GNAT family N-acetyltransferase [Rhodospirillaceae bacterium]
MLPSFETSRLLLRPRSMADFDACLAMDRDPDVTRYIRGPWDDPEEHRRFLADRIQRQWPPGQGYWSIFAKDAPDQFLGWVLLIPYEGVGPEVDIGWRLNRRSWGKGYATEATLPVVAHAFGAAGLPKLVADIDPRNTPSMRVAEKIGMTFVGEGTYEDGNPCRSYVLTAKDFASRARSGENS